MVVLQNGGKERERGTILLIWRVCQLNLVWYHYSLASDVYLFFLPFYLPSLFKLVILIQTCMGFLKHGLDQRTLTYQDIKSINRYNRFFIFFLLKTPFLQIIIFLECFNERIIKAYFIGTFLYSIEGEWPRKKYIKSILFFIIYTSIVYTACNVRCHTRRRSL